MKMKVRNKKNNKKVGNKFENDVSKYLNTWFFNNECILKRHPSSGAEKSIYSSDIFPFAQLPKTWNDWPLHIECKDGYSKDSFITNANDRISKWYIDAAEKILNSKTERIIWIIWKIPNKGILLVSDLFINNNELLYEINLNKKLFIYNFKNIIKQEIDFIKLFFNNEG